MDSASFSSSTGTTNQGSKSLAPLRPACDRHGSAWPRMLHLLMQAAADPSPAGEQAARDLLVRGPTEAQNDWQELDQPGVWLPDDAPSAQLHRLAAAVLQAFDPPWLGHLAQAVPQALPPGEDGLRLALRSAWLQQAATALALDPARLDTLPSGTTTCSLRVLLHHPHTGHGLFGVLQLRLAPASGARLALVAAPGSAFTPCDADFHSALQRATAWLRAVTDADATRDLALAWDIHVPGGQLEGLGGPSAGAAVALAGAWLLQHQLLGSEARLRQALAGIQPWMLREAGVSAEVVDAEGTTAHVGGVPEKADALHSATQDGGTLHLFLHPVDVDELQGHALPRLVLHGVTSLLDLATRLAKSVQPDADRAAVLSCLPLDRPPADPNDDTSPPPAVPAVRLQALVKRGADVRSLADYALHRWCSWAVQDGGMLHLRFVPLQLAHLGDSPGSGQGTPFKGLVDLLDTLRQWPPERHQPTALLLRGVAGAGKSTLLQQHEMGLSLDFLRHWHQRAAGRSTAAVHELPLYVPLRSLPASEPDALAWLQRQMAASHPQCDDLHRLLGNHPVHGQPQLRLRLLLDGLNELPVPPNRSRLQRAERVLRQLTDRLPAMLPPLLCARSQYGFDSLVQASGMAVDVQAWDDERISLFIRRFFAGRVEDSDRMLAVMAEIPSIHALCGIPFNARHLCEHWHQNGRLGKSNAIANRQLLRQALVRELQVDSRTDQPVHPLLFEDEFLLTRGDIECLLDDRLWGIESTTPWPTEGHLLRLIFDQAAEIQRITQSSSRLDSTQLREPAEVLWDNPVDASRSVVSGFPRQLRLRWRLAVDSLGLLAPNCGDGKSKFAFARGWGEYLSEIGNLRLGALAPKSFPEWAGESTECEFTVSQSSAMVERRLSSTDQDLPEESWNENWELLESLNYHPVVLCGPVNSGRSVAIASLISFLKLSGRAIVKLGPWPFRIKTAEGRMRRSIAEGVFFTQADDFRRGLAPHSTGVSWPVLVPLQIDVLDDGLTSKESYRPVKSVRIALFDVSGEHFKPFPPSGIEYRSGPMDLQTLLRSFQGGLSMLYMGPTTRLSGYTNNGSRAEPHETDDARDRVREDPDSNLVNAIRAYDNGRSSFRLDRHLFVLAKWDLAVPVDDPSFDRPKMRVVIGEIEKRFPEAWATFKALPATAKAKMVRQYCAGIISNRTVTIFPSGSRERELLDGHSKAMWNWIYRGATRSPDCPDGMDLFQDSTHNRFRFWQNFFR